MNFAGPPTPPSKRKLEGQSFKNAQQAWLDMNTRFMPHPFLKYQKVLGFGGFGVVQQWGTFKPDGTRDQDIAIKACMGWPAQILGTQNEIRAAQGFKNCEHLIQLRDIAPHPSTIDTYNNPASDSPIIIMEVMRHGALSTLVERVIAARKSINGDLERDGEKLLEFIPNRILWRIMLCLIRGCLGMAYRVPVPLPQRPGQNPNPPPPTWREEVREGVAPRAIVHFDLDSKNVFLGDIAYPGSDFEHEKFPICKIGDYGLMCNWNNNWSDTLKDVRSKYGKPSFMAPEQKDRTRYTEPDIYGSQTNVWGIGICLFACMGQTFRFENTPGFEEMRILRDGSAINTFGHILIPNGIGAVDGDEIYNDVDVELRETVARCLHSDHTQRPGLQELLDIALRNIRAGDQLARDTGGTPPPPPGQPDDSHRRRPAPGQPESNTLLRRFLRNYFLDAVPPQDRYAPYWNRGALPPEQAPDQQDDEWVFLA